jgi:hypothetical protein
VQGRWPGRRRTPNWLSSVGHMKSLGAFADPEPFTCFRTRRRFSMGLLNLEMFAIPIVGEAAPSVSLRLAAASGFRTDAAMHCAINIYPCILASIPDSDSPRRIGRRQRIFAKARRRRQSLKRRSSELCPDFFRSTTHRRA